MIAAELAHRRFVQLKQNFTQLLGFRITGCEALSVNLAQRADEGVSVLVADSPSLLRWRLSGPALLMLLSILPEADSILPPGPIATRHNHAVPRRTLHAGSVCSGHESLVGTFETWQRTLRMSVYRGRPEVIGAQSERRYRPITDAAPAKLLRTLRTTYLGYFRSGQDLPHQPSKLECPNEQPFRTFNCYSAVQ